MDEEQKTKDQRWNASKDQKLAPDSPIRAAPPIPRPMQHATRNTQHAIRPTPATINLHIDHLILHGFPPGDRARLGRAVEQELARLLAEGGLPPVLAKGGTLARLDGGQFSIAAGAPVDQIGAQIAQVLYRSLG
jgi:hypothetical protein